MTLDELNANQFGITFVFKGKPSSSETFIEASIVKRGRIARWFCRVSNGIRSGHVIDGALEAFNRLEVA